MTLVRLTTSRVLCLLCAAIVCSGPLWFSLAPSSSLLLALGIAIVLITWARRARRAINTDPRQTTHATLTTATNEDHSARIAVAPPRHQRRVMVPRHRRSALRRNEGNTRRRVSLSGAPSVVENAPRVWPRTEPSSRYIH